MNMFKNFYQLITMLVLSCAGSTSLWAQATDPFPDINPYDYYGNMNMSVKVLEDGVPLVQDVVVAVYSGQTLRGKGAPEPGDKHPDVIYLTIYGDTSGDPLYFKIYTQGTTVEVAPENLTYTINEILGTPKKPYEINITDVVAEEKTTFELKLAKGWNWISHNRANAVTPSSLFGTNVVEVKSQTKGVIRDTKYGMVGNLKEMVATEAYKVRTTAADTKVRKVVDYPFKAATHAITLQKGWNWLSYPMEHQASLGEALKNFAPQEGDYLVGQAGFATYSQGAWNGIDLEVLTPGKGYMYRSGETKPVTFNSQAGAKVRVAANMRKVEDESSPWTCDIYKYPNRMPTIVRLYKADEVADMNAYDVAAFCDGECRGIGKVVNDVVMMNVCGEGGETITFKALDKTTGTIMDIQESVSFTGDVLGAYTEPFKLTLEEEDLTGISTIRSSIAGEEAIYNAAGQRMHTNAKALPKGLHIMRSSDGKVKKILVK